MKAVDIMTPRVITISSEASIAEAIRMMLQNRISGLPVVDAAGDLVGIVTEGDFLRRAEDKTERQRPHWLEFILGPGRLADEYVHTHSRKVGAVMTPSVVTADESASVEQVVRLMEKGHIKRIPIVRGRKLVGIVSRANLLHILAHLAAEARPLAKDDADIRRRVMVELAKQPWAPMAGVNVVVRDRIVELKGAIFDERQREALKVVAENVPGVQDVRDHLVWVEPVSGTTLDPPEEKAPRAARR